MKVYKTSKGIVIENGNKFYPAGNPDWEQFINDDKLWEKANDLIRTIPEGNAELIQELEAPMGDHQELWACGVTYLRSKIGRQEESKDGGGGDFYARVYEAERPEVFMKANPSRVSGHRGFVRIRKDSSWDVPEPELTLVVTASGKIVGYTIGNDMSSRSIEGENPLYLPQAKTYDECAALGPGILITKEPLPAGSMIRLTIRRKNQTVFEGDVSLQQMKRSPEELAAFVYRECSFPYGCLIMTGTGIVPPSDFTLASGDEISIAIDGIGELINRVR